MKSIKDLVMVHVMLIFMLSQHTGKYLFLQLFCLLVGGWNDRATGTHRASLSTDSRNFAVNSSMAVVVDSGEIEQK